MNGLRTCFGKSIKCGLCEGKGANGKVGFMYEWSKCERKQENVGNDMGNDTVIGVGSAFGGGNDMGLDMFGVATKIGREMVGLGSDTVRIAVRIGLG